MNKGKTLLIFALVFLALSLSLTSAKVYTFGSSSNTNYWTSAPYEQIQKPITTFTPTTTEKSSSSSKAGDSYTRYYKGPLSERIAIHYVTYQKGKSGRMASTVKDTLYEKFVGEQEFETKNTNSASNQNNYYSQYSPNPTSSNGGFSITYNPQTEFSTDSYSPSSVIQTSQYPKLTSEGYYNWRY